jgi:hypothetical protein
MRQSASFATILVLLAWAVWAYAQTITNATPGVVVSYAPEMLAQWYQSQAPTPGTAKPIKTIVGRIVSVNPTSGQVEISSADIPVAGGRATLTLPPVLVGAAKPGGGIVITISAP